MGRVTEREAERLLNLSRHGRLDRDDLVMSRDYVATGPALEGVGPRCRRCGCSEYHACPGGCYWVERNLCSRCV